MQYQSRKNFEDFSASYPEEKISLSASSNQPSLRYLDLFSPIGKGQRVLVSAPPCTGATTLLKDIALSVQAKIDQGENLHLLALLIAERPEEVTEFCRTVSEEVVYTTFDQEAQEHLRAARLVFSRAKRLAEMGEDVVLLLDSLTRLTLAADACAPTGKTLPCGLEIGAFHFPRTCLSQARKLTGGGSITVIAIVACTAGNEVEEVIYSEFEKICNSRISLSIALAAKRIFPAIDVKNSYTRRAEALLTPKEAECADYVRQNLLDDNGEALNELINQTPDNATFINKILNK